MKNDDQSNMGRMNHASSSENPEQELKQGSNLEAEDKVQAMEAASLLASSSDILKLAFSHDLGPPA